jgi:hypothetical protein
MKFNAIIAILSFAVFASAATNPCPGPWNPCASKRSLGFSSKPREWLNAVRAVEAESSPVEAEIKE